MTEDVGHRSFKAGLIVHVLPVVVTERLLIEVAKQMERFDAHVSTVDTALQQRPEVLKSVRVHAPINVLDGVVNHLMLELIQPVVRLQGVRVQRGPGFNVLAYFSL